MLLHLSTLNEQGLQPSLLQECTRAQLGLMMEHLGLCLGCSQHLRLHSLAGLLPQILMLDHCQGLLKYHLWAPEPKQMPEDDQEAAEDIPKDAAEADQ